MKKKKNGMLFNFMRQEQRKKKPTMLWVFFKK